MPRKLRAGLADADMLSEEHAWEEARDRLIELAQEYPNEIEVFSRLADVCFQARDTRGYLSAVERLARLDPDDSQAARALAAGYAANGFLVLAVRELRRVLSRWPGQADANKVRKMLAELEENLAGFFRNLALPPDQAFELAVLHDEVRLNLEQGRLAEARRLAKKLLARFPEFVPAMNNLAETEMADGNYAVAIQWSRRVLDIDAENMYALANLVQLMLFTGQMDKAQEYAQRLKALSLEAGSHWIKMAEALAYLGDDRGVLDTLEGVTRVGDVPANYTGGMLYHLAAAASMRLGDQAQARRYWQEALRLDPSSASARANLDDLDKPAHERDAPWMFDFGMWAPHKAVNRLYNAARAAERHNRKGAIKESAQKILVEQPELLAMAPHMLDRGDRPAREFVIRLAEMTESPELFEMVRQFALGQRGADKQRMQAAFMLNRHNILPSGQCRLWIKGEWRQILLMGVAVSPEAVDSGHSPAVQDLLERANEALFDGAAQTAQFLLEKALELEPDAPDLLNNLALSMERQGQTEKAYAITQRIFAIHPDYPLARITMARMDIEEGKLKEANDTLMPLLQRESLRPSEFVALCRAEIELGLARKDADMALNWLGIWESVDKDNPELAWYQKRIGNPARS